MRNFFIPAQASSEVVVQTENGKITKPEKHKHQKPNSDMNASASRENPCQASFLAISPELGCFMETSSSVFMKLSFVWI